MAIIKKIFDLILRLFSKYPKGPEATERALHIDVEISAEIKRKIINKRPHLENVENFINKFGDSALSAENETGISALVMLAQVALETGWGNSILKVYENGKRISSNNLFNIKAFKSWPGRKGTAKVWEIIKGKKVWIDGEPFRIYGNFEDSFIDYCSLIISNKRYSKAIDAIYNPELYIIEMHKAGYATDPEYAKKMISIIKKNFQYEIIQCEPIKTHKNLK